MIRTFAARFKRWGYLLCVGSWKGERMLDIYDNRGLAMILSGTGRQGEQRRVWWVRKDLLGRMT